MFIFNFNLTRNHVHQILLFGVQLIQCFQAFENPTKKSTYSLESGQHECMVVQDKVKDEQFRSV